MALFTNTPTKDWASELCYSSASVQSQIAVQTESAAPEGVEAFWVGLRSGEGGKSKRRGRSNGRGGAGGEAAAAGERPHRGPPPRPEPRAGRRSRRRRHHDPPLRRRLCPLQPPPPPRRQGPPTLPFFLPRIFFCTGLNPRCQFAGPRGGARRCRFRVRLRWVWWGGAAARLRCRGFQVYPNLARPWCCLVIVCLVLVQSSEWCVLTPMLCSVQDVRGSSKSFPKHEARHVSDHKVRMFLVFPCYCTAIFVSIYRLLNIYYCIPHFALAAVLLLCVSLRFY